MHRKSFTARLFSSISRRLLTKQEESKRLRMCLISVLTSTKTTDSTELYICAVCSNTNTDSSRIWKCATKSSTNTNDQSPAYSVLENLQRQSRVRCSKSRVICMTNFLRLSVMQTTSTLAATNKK